MRDAGHAGKKVDRFIDFHLQHIANAFATPADGQSLGAEAGTATGLTRHFHIGQEAHLDGAHALPFTTRAAAFPGVEAEAACGITSRLGLQGFGKQFADRVPKTNVGGGARAGRFANRGLVDFEHAIDRFKALHIGTRGQSHALACVLCGAARKGRTLTHQRLHIGQQNIAGQSGFTRATHAGHRNQTPERHLHIDLAQVVQVGAREGEPLQRSLHQASQLHRMLHRMQQIAPGLRIG